MVCGQRQGQTLDGGGCRTPRERTLCGSRRCITPSRDCRFYVPIDLVECGVPAPTRNYVAKSTINAEWSSTPKPTGIV